MEQQTDYPTLAIAIAVGIVFGIGSAFIGVAAGLPTVAVASITGAVTAALVPVIYRARSKKGDNQKS
jgi:hypothetical protein